MVMRVIPRGRILPLPVGEHAPEWERLDLEIAKERHPRCIPLLSGTEEEAGSQLLETRYRARKPVWTRTAPAEVGWWWCRIPPETIGVPVRVERIRGELQWSLVMEKWIPVTYPGLEWSDRAIEEPEPGGMTWRSAAEKSTRKEPPPASNPRSRPWSPAS
jgi:hypothetical protein